jgi:hypothetical protein
MTDKQKRLDALERLSALDQELELDQLYWPTDRELDGLKLVCTCGACPEQYDVFDATGEKVGYLRLRHGHFRAECPDVFEETVYAATPKGDGIFETAERAHYLREAVAAIKTWMARRQVNGGKDAERSGS